MLGEIYWKCELGEETQVTDFVCDNDVLSREAGGGEANWSYSAPMPWAVIANAFGPPVDRAGAQGIQTGSGSSSSGGCASTTVVIIIVVLILLICALGACGSCLGDGSSSSGSGTGSGYRSGSGVYSGGK